MSRPDLPPDLTDPAQQAAYLEDAFLAGDASLVSLALKEIGTLRRIPVVLDENPPLSELLRVLADLRLEVSVRAG